MKHFLSVNGRNLHTELNGCPFKYIQQHSINIVANTKIHLWIILLVIGQPFLHVTRYDLTPSRENLTQLCCMQTKKADQTMHPHTLNSAFNIHIFK